MDGVCIGENSGAVVELALVVDCFEGSSATTGSLTGQASVAVEIAVVLAAVVSEIEGVEVGDVALSETVGEA